ncbi:hypothetical protein GCM10020255_089580 [Rhodococcus baikonurensis]
MEMVPAEIAGQVSRKLTIPTVGIGAGSECDAQVLVWQDMAGYTSGKTAKFVKRFGNVGDELRSAAAAYASEVRTGAFRPQNTVSDPRPANAACLSTSQGAFNDR